MPFSKIIFIVGPTAVGKSDIALSLAKRMNGEIVSCDSMQIYKEINIASNKPSERERKDVAHHLIDLVSIEERFDVARFFRLATDAVEGIHKRGAVPIVVAGSGMYMQILLDGIFEAKEKNGDIRDRLKKRIEEEGLPALYRELQKVDPQAAGKIHTNDERRIIRALEVFESSRQPISSLQKRRQGWWGKYDIFLFGLRMEREVLYQKINERVDQMFERGLVKEVEDLSRLHLSLTAKQLIGVKEVLHYLQRKDTLKEAAEKIKQNTRRFAKRQMTWFRKEKRIRWIDVHDRDHAKDILQRILKEIE